jgi:5-methylcytosine-specific restriction endonuclease McrA
MAQIDLSTLPRSPKEAKAAGSKYYFTGRPCAEGHLAARYTSVRRCALCLNPAHGRGDFVFKCLHCGVSAASRKGGTQYCSDKCRSDAGALSDSLKRAARRTPVQCRICGVSFVPKVKGQSPTCESPVCWEENNKRKRQAAASAYYYRNPGKCRNAARAWFNSNPGKTANYQHQRRSRMAGNKSGTISKREIKRLLESPCLACGATGSSTVEHLIPVSRGGSHTIGNLAPLCGPCNSSKGPRTWMEWRIKKGARLVA